ncbi:cytochrome c oxidase assembly protein COX16 homolog, mitochondrial isoform X2 [Micropterus salmoides]|uniref:cytochrome c oxidase assembly protein COX16 homolog, mitochondrial isoform X2 n=1 Tax=Micropterus salmoides TaxID=27706 RepID=UPI0018EDDABB|nr:cytochrome c oxidase assembly protein COX16 homolog, mitochondrial isoform X2 [Micropterus salmoides]
MFNLKSLQRNKTVKYGVPMLLDPSLEAKVNVQRQSAILEEEYEKIKELNLEEWKNIRGPRPWEDSREYQEQQRTRQDKKA